MTNAGESELSFMDFLKRLKKEVELQQKCGTSWGKEISSIGYLIATKSKSLSIFMDVETSEKTISDLMPTLSREKVTDVARMLYKTVKQLHHNATLPEEIREYVRHKKQNQKPLTFIGKSKQDKKG
ncbi:hypothetical protein HNR63_002401 [Anoxybacillus kamchatkensis]|uniref:hypothetical protein n=1 Tax=Anoxybacillus ayderensis TaxID=265546 RepID=UPI0015EC2D8A|nr:hypothetical protein [Anoxybacillus ayderensis]MBA2879329.1 hypothetical protein [Anoxybacillus ayderensis]